MTFKGPVAALVTVTHNTVTHGYLWRSVHLLFLAVINRRRLAGGSPPEICKIT